MLGIAILSPQQYSPLINQAQRDSSSCIFIVSEPTARSRHQGADSAIPAMPAQSCATPHNESKTPVLRLQWCSQHAVRYQSIHAHHKAVQSFVVCMSKRAPSVRPQKCRNKCFNKHHFRAQEGLNEPIHFKYFGTITPSGDCGDRRRLPIRAENTLRIRTPLGSPQ